MSNNSFYITTPIYYVNDKPHIGHAYTTILADVLSRYHRLLKVPTFFLTGTDEHGQKVVQSAAKNGITPLEQCNSTVVRFQDLWKKLEITNDGFIRTTEDRHKKIVRNILQTLYERGEIYKDNYEGFYCVPCERFYTEKDLLEESCPDCNRGVDKIAETNYFFKMGKYQTWLIDYINENPQFIQPPHRRNETLGFLRKPLGDLCISRPKSRLSWGIELPFDSDYVCYVWFDALINYISAHGYGIDEDQFRRWWPASCHLIGKDILTTHSVYWPTMLKAIGIPMPKTIFAHGWWLVGRDKMGKSLGNVVDPMMMCEEYGVDSFRYFLLAEMTPGQDASFTEQAFIRRYNMDLADGLGNMLNRVIRLINRHCNGRIPECGKELDIDQQLKSISLKSVEEMKNAITQMKLDRGIEKVMGVVRECNRYFEKTAPWELIKKGELNRLHTVLYTAIESLQVISGLLFPILPGKMEILRKVLGIDQNHLDPDFVDLKTWGTLKPGTKVGDIHSLFPRIDTKPKIEEERNQGTLENKKSKSSSTQAKMSENVLEMVDFNDFKKNTFKNCKSLSCRKMLKMQTDFFALKLRVGLESRQIVAGIASNYTPDEMIGKQIVIVDNLKPVKLRGLQSNGMLLAAKDGEKLHLISIDKECKTGLEVG